MPDIIYPDCQRKIPSYEVECPNCSFLLQKYLQENGIDNLKKKILCTRCGQEGNGLMGAVKIKCEYCNIPMVQTRYGIREFVILYNESLEGVPEKVMDSMGISEREYQDMYAGETPEYLDCKNSLMTNVNNSEREAPLLTGNIYMLKVLSITL